MRVSFAPAFLRLIGKLDPSVKQGVKDTISKVIDFCERQRKTPGLGPKHLRENLWEARSGLRVRVVYSLSGDRLHFILAGSHDDVKNFLKRH